MPNWVYNTLTLHGDNDKLLEIATVLEARHPLDVTHWKHERLDENESYPHRPISFTNLIAPPEDIWDDYVAICTPDRFSDPNNWYNWNNQVWGTKWNACDATLEIEDSTMFVYRFCTAWSQPSEELMQALAKVIANAGVEMATWSFEEEQGWGGGYEYDCQDELFYLETSYAEPNSHTDYKHRDRADSCVCTWAEVEDWYDDCPREEAK
jgi:hypothetical protein